MSSVGTALMRIFSPACARTSAGANANAVAPIRTAALEMVPLVRLRFASLTMTGRVTLGKVGLLCRERARDVLVFRGDVDHGLQHRGIRRGGMRDADHLAKH